MSPDEIERTMQFLLHQQAQFAADFERLSTKTDRIADGLIGLTGIVGHVTDNLAHLTDHVGHVTDRLGDVTDRVAHVADGLEQVTERLGQVTDRLDRLAAAQERTDQQMRDLQQFLRETDSRLSAHFERHLREDHGYRPS